MCIQTDRMAAIERGERSWTDGGLCYYSRALASGSCVCVCIAGTPERQASGAAFVSVNQKERKNNNNGVLGKGLLRICTYQPIFKAHHFIIGSLLN